MFFSLNILTGYRHVVALNVHKHRKRNSSFAVSRELGDISILALMSSEGQTRVSLLQAGDGKSIVQNVRSERWMKDGKGVEGWRF